MSAATIHDLAEDELSALFKAFDGRSRWVWGKGCMPGMSAENDDRAQQSILTLVKAGAKPQH